MPELNIKQQPELPAHPFPIVSIGLGGIVHDAHYPAYRKAGFQVVGGYDPNTERARMMQEKFGIPRLYESLQEAVDASPPDAVFDVAVPGSKIMEILQQLPPHRAVLIQKPMGETFDEARAILRLCREKNLIAAINFQLRFAPNVIAARDMIAQGLIGELNDVEARIQLYTPWTLWPFLLRLPRLEILYHSIHYIDAVRSFLGDPDGVYCKTLKHPIAADLAATRTMLILDYGERVRANIMTNHGHIYGTERQQSYLKFEGSKGAIQVRMGVNMDYPRGVPDTLEYVLLEADKPPHWEQLDIPGSWFPEAFIGPMASLMRYVAGETDLLPTSVEDAIMTMAVVEAAYTSSDSGGTPLPGVTG